MKTNAVVLQRPGHLALSCLDLTPAGEDDIVVPPDQAFATARLLGTPPAALERATEPCGHLGLFMGRGALGHSWRRIARWLQTDIGDATGARISA